jgi:hypothetical protein
MWQFWLTTLHYLNSFRAMLHYGILQCMYEALSLQLGIDFVCVCSSSPPPVWLVVACHS